MKNIIVIVIAVAVLIAAGVGLYFFIQSPIDTGEFTAPIPQPIDRGEDPEVPDEPEFPDESTIGASVEGRDIMAYHFGTGETQILFVGGMHGGYEWNTVSLAYELIDYLEENPSAVPSNQRVTIVPVLNPDGLFKTVGSAGRFSTADVPATLAETVPGRFNANDVDLNRNFDCNWQEVGTWQNREVSGGTEPFSEPESKALKNYIETNNPTAVVVWYSAAGGVFASKCNEGALPETITLTNLYATATGYPAYEDFDFYNITGDAINWLAKNNIPAISVLLTTHDDIEWSKNKPGIEAVLERYAD
jgi:hypothetical protein